MKEADRESESRRIVMAAARDPLDYGKSPLIRAVLLRTQEEEHVLCIVMNHFISDGWSVNVLIRELILLYEAFAKGAKSPLTELPIQYKDYARWQREWLQGEVLEAMVSYWKKTTEKTTPYPELELPFAHAKPTDLDYHRSGQSETIVLPLPLYNSLKSLGKREGVTLYMVLLTALNLLLRHYTGLDHIGVFSSLANRSRPETQVLIGWFSQFHVIPADLSGDPRFLDLLKQVRESVLGAYEHQEIPYFLLLKQLVTKFPDYDMPKFNAPFIYFDVPGRSGMAKQMGDLLMSPFEVSETLKQGPIDAGVEIIGTEEANGLKIDLNYPGGKFDVADIKEMLRRYQFLLESAVSNPEARISELLKPLSSEVEAAV